jgi:hypothetical protein
MQIHPGQIYDDPRMGRQLTVLHVFQGGDQPYAAVSDGNGIHRILLAALHDNPNRRTGYRLVVDAVTDTPPQL